MKDPYRAILWHVFLFPITVLIVDMIIQFGIDPHALGVFILAIPFLYIGLCLPAAITGLAYWHTRMRKRKNKMIAFIIVGLTAEISCLIWFLTVSSFKKDDIFDALLAVGIAISILYWITTLTLHPKTDPDAVSNG
ncbi:hypothetical protein DDZ13_14920 [Coraliomargarita sinensis]|uniref:Uncharacterized protein n=1 Tax=Coraliomargarita sinensis TaxID=2174842 RepID=A0A317ZGH8_9BACT|nr:hypothetical protein [Coraliomargarita sinensis]PXA02879.1 hypothetical protein DDZ13_14920 [Coraliomargarita sinensis]